MAEGESLKIKDTTERLICVLGSTLDVRLAIRL